MNEKERARNMSLVKSLLRESKNICSVVYKVQSRSFYASFFSERIQTICELKKEELDKRALIVDTLCSIKLFPKHLNSFRRGSLLFVDFSIVGWDDLAEEPKIVVDGKGKKLLIKET